MGTGVLDCLEAQQGHHRFECYCDLGHFHPLRNLRLVRTESAALLRDCLKADWVLRSRLPPPEFALPVYEYPLAELLPGDQHL